MANKSRRRLAKRSTPNSPLGRRGTTVNEAKEFLKSFDVDELNVQTRIGRPNAEQKRLLDGLSGMYGIDGSRHIIAAIHQLALAIIAQAEEEFGDGE